MPRCNISGCEEAMDTKAFQLCSLCHSIFANDEVTTTTWYFWTWEFDGTEFFPSFPLRHKSHKRYIFGFGEAMAPNSLSFTLWASLSSQTIGTRSQLTVVVIMWYLSILGGNVHLQMLLALLFEWVYPRKRYQESSTGGSCHNVISLDLRKPWHQVSSSFPLWSKRHKSCVWAWRGYGIKFFNFDLWMSLSSEYQNDFNYRRLTFYDFLGFMAPNSFFYRTLNKFTLSNDFRLRLLPKCDIFGLVGQSIRSPRSSTPSKESHESANFLLLEYSERCWSSCDISRLMAPNKEFIDALLLKLSLDYSTSNIN